MFDIKVKKFEEFKKISRFTYILLFAPLRGILMYDNRTMFFIWIICALIGGVLLVIKNNSITNKYYKNKIKFFDIFILISSIILYFDVPIPFIIKDIIFFPILTVYIYIYHKLLFKGKLIGLGQ